MRVVLILSALFLASCYPSKPQSTHELIPEVEVKVIMDTIHVPVVEVVRDTIFVNTADCFVAKYKLERIQRYIDITESRPANRTFFYGWIKRVMDE